MIERTHVTPQKYPGVELFLLVAAPLYLYLNLFTKCIPFLLEGDQNFFWVYALRMLHGQNVYRDFFQFTPPGTDFIYLALFKLFGPYLWVTNLIVLLLGTMLCWLCFTLAKRLMEQDLALLASVLFLVLIYGARLDATHHWFSVLASLSAIKLLMPERTPPRIALAGVLLGLASFFTQTTGMAGAIAILFALLYEHTSDKKTWRTFLAHALLLLTTFTLTWVALSGYFIAKVGWKQLLYFEIFYPQRYVRFSHEFLFPGVHGPLPDIAQRLSVYALVICTYPLVLLHCWRRRHAPDSKERMRLVLLSLMGLFLLLTVITRANWNRLYIISMPALILLLWFVARLGPLRRYAAAALWIVVTCLAARQINSRQHHPGTITELPAGRAVVPQPSYEQFNWLMQHTKPGDLFLQAQWLNLYAPLQLQSPIFADGLWPSDVTRPEYVALAMQQVERQKVKYILWSPRLAAPEENDDHKDHDHLGPFHAYLLNNYTLVHVFSNRDEIWERQ